MKNSAQKNCHERLNKKLLAGLVVALGMTFISVGCAIVTTDPFALGGVNPDMDSYHERMLKDDMRAMARSVRRLLVLETDGVLPADERHTRVMRELEILEGIGEVINEDSEIYNYSVSSPYMGSFLHDVSMAREFAEGEPPDYQPATGLVKSCMFCHQNLSTR